MATKILKNNRICILRQFSSIYCQFVRTDWLYRTIIGCASLCWHNSPIRYASWAKHSHVAEVMGNWLWAIGYRVLGIGYWLWVMSDWWLAIWYGRHCRYPCLYTLHPTPYVLPLHPTLYTISANAPASNLSPYRLIVCQRQCFDADAKQMQERYEVARVKTDGQFGRTSKVRPKGDKFGVSFGEHSNSTIGREVRWKVRRT